MKKSLFALAITGALALTAAQADTVLYGSIRYGVDFGYNHDKPGQWGYTTDYLGNVTNIKNLGRRGMDVRDEGSRFGLKGGEELGNGVKIVYHLEWGFDGVEGLGNGSGFANRIAMIGIAGSFGTFAIGRLDNPFKQMLVNRSEVDDANSNWRGGATAAAGDVFWGVMGGINTFNAKMAPRVGNALAYISPTWGGFGFNVAIITDGTKGYDNPGILNKNRAVDIWTVNLNYAHESGFFANAGYITGDAIKDVTKRAYVYGLHVGFSNEQFGVDAAFARGETKGNATFGSGLRGDFWSDTNAAVLAPGLNNNNYKHTTTGWDLGGHFSFGPDYASTVRLNVGQAKADKKHNGSSWTNYGVSNKETNKMTTWALGFEQKLSTRTRVWVEYENTSVKQNFNTHSGYSSTDYGLTKYRSKKFKDDRVNIGIRHDF